MKTEVMAELAQYGFLVTDVFMLNIDIPESFNKAIQRTEIVIQEKQATEFKVAQEEVKAATRLELADINARII